MLDILLIFGATYLVWVPGAALLIYFFALPRREKLNLAVLSVVALPVAFVLSRIVKFFYFSERPFADGSIAPLIAHAADNGFPSDHALFAFAFAFLALAHNRPLGLALSFIAVSVALARIGVGVHNPIDVVGAAVVAALGIALAIRARSKVLASKVK